MFEVMFKAKVDELRSLFSATKDVGHNGEKGGFREAFVVSLLQQFLPAHYGLGSGVVVDKWGRQSPQVDIVIFDRRTLPPIFERGSRGIYPMDSVLRVVEVKSVVNGASLDQFAKLVSALDPKNPEGLKMASKGKLDDGLSYYPVCALFGFESVLGDLAKKISEHEILKHKNNPIYLDDGQVCGVKFEEGHFLHGYRCLNIKGDNYALRIFIGVLFDEIEATANSRSDYKPMDWLIGAS
ncbi:TPA: DUF6602 domain-containing protein [Pseudomonas aeruginosa]|uniref:DUF6602 domain-containing protein n=1 Tax=Pseudomonas aeruginosa TaxID=287 RepID=UPI0029055B8B|nr:DUF6602 domain-containing protein [Pseudomonas aeruginosa]MDU0692561.1 hypothetical protein [Pseudomonas aeruginosa]HBN9644844.1 hypothetical protein [Pseudomonas aeruginosa]HBN9900103.1 hypothetical protein [Pseudomonas aeruginosa]